MSIKPSAKNPEYFYIKVGFSNSLLKASIDEDGHGALWIGYEDFLSPTLSKSGKIELSNYSKKEMNSRKDIDRLYRIAAPMNRDQNRLFTFSESHLFIWEISGDIHEPNEGQIYKQQILNFLDSNLTNKKWVLKCFEKGIVEFTDEQLTKGRYLPVKCIKKIPRDILPPTVNTLAVYQYFTRGTIRNLSSIGEDRNKFLNPLLPDNKLLSTAIYETHQDFKENAYGQFFRLFFDNITNPSSENAIFSNEIPDELIWATLNPVQMEAFVSLLCLDLGLVVDFFTANSLDHIDVQARHSKKTKTDLIDSFFLHCKIDQQLNQKILKFQCKAYFTESSPINKTILFTPTGNDSEENSNHFSIQTLKAWDQFHENNFPHLFDWMETLKKLYSAKK